MSRRFLDRAFWSALAILLTTSPAARAGFSFEITDAAGVPTATFNLSAIGETVDLSIYLRADGSDLALLQSEGLFSAGISLTYGAPTGVAGVLSTADIAPNPAWVNLTPAPTADASAAGFTGDVDFNAFLYPDAEGRILLGTFRLTALGSGTTTLGAVDRIAGFDETLTGSGDVLDGLITPGAALLTVAVVPEPSTVVVVATGCLMLGFLNRRRRTKPIPGVE